MTLSIYTRLIYGAFVLAMASPALASGSEPPAQKTRSAPFGILVAQSTDAVLSDRDLRRLNHYAAQTLEALQAFNTGSESEISTLRQRVQRLVDAGQRSGLGLVQSADYFTAYLAENSNTPLPGALLDAAGRFDARSLFASTMIYLENQAPIEVDVAAVDEADLAAIGTVAKRLSPQTPVTPQTASLPVIEQPAVIVAALPAIAPDAPADVRAILERVRLRGDEWVITVETGDSLGQFANALYGDTLFFQRIFQANLNVLTTPNTITVGQELVLPKS